MLPNAITIAGLLLAVIGLALPYEVGVWFFIASFLADVLDGFVARKLGKTTKFGGVLDSVSDKIVEILFIYYLSLWFGQANLCIIAAGLSIMISYTKHRAGLSSKTFFDRPQRMIFLLISPFYFAPMLYIFIALCLIDIALLLRNI